MRRLDRSIHSGIAVCRTLAWSLLGFVFFIVGAGGWAAVPSAVLEAEWNRVAVMEKASQAVVSIFAPDGGGGGSGVVISASGYALTNFHVAQPCGDWMKCGLTDGRVYNAVIVGVDPTGDLALIKLDGRDDFPHAAMGDSDRVTVGDWVFAMGNPFLLAADFKPTVTYGIVSGTHRYQPPAGTILEYTDCLQTDASINPGNSGGPLFDAHGLLIGINGRGSFEKRGRVNVGVGYAISINQVKNFLGHLRSGRVVDHGTLNAQMGHDDEGRVVVVDILEDSDAYRRGLRYDDEVVQFAGRAIGTPNAFKNVLGIMPQGWRVPLSFRRDGRRTDCLVRLAAVHSPAELLDQLAREVPSPDKAPPSPNDVPGSEPRPSENDGGDRPPNDGLPVMARRKPAAMPGEIARQFEARRGFANYYFNRIETERVLAAWRNAQPAGAAENWVFSGKLETGSEYRLEITANGASLALPSGTVRLNDTAALDSALLPAGSGGLLEAMYLWRRLAVEGRKGFTDLTYAGTAPVGGYRGLADVVVGRQAGVEVQFYFAAEHGRLLALELYPHQDSDPCEVYFNYSGAQDNGEPLAKFSVRFGDVSYAVFQVVDGARRTSGGKAREDKP